MTPQTLRSSTRASSRRLRACACVSVALSGHSLRERLACSLPGARGLRAPASGRVHGYASRLPHLHGLRAVRGPRVDTLLPASAPPAGAHINGAHVWRECSRAALPRGAGDEALVLVPRVQLVGSHRPRPSPASARRARRRPCWWWTTAPPTTPPRSPARRGARFVRLVQPGGRAWRPRRLQAAVARGYHCVVSSLAATASTSRPQSAPAGRDRPARADVATPARLSRRRHGLSR